ncbi:sugar ABC transporter substrate-binding protein [Actinoallomurus purpureus]|uniref:ABC transporter substrate-binding protein n=1 Tax=Actinoallomurus purpureus TaxID=478114 RepID=UPI00209248B1|nr:sugar ABC transporter substrate-binding protein [Actinoallomurus purpureus]MCO6003483.1 sugar ABC transporter substrate-binding protein [Actinoallomurus purpureus]
MNLLPPRLRGMTAGRCALALAVASSLALSACGSGDGGGSGSEAGSLTETDYYDSAPQNTQLPKVLDECGDQVGVKIVHQEVPRAQFMPKLLQQASSRSLPDLALVDNPDLQQLAATGGLVPLSQAGLSTGVLYPSIVAAGRYQGETYGIAPGVNGLALFYNKDMFASAGLTPPTTWDQLTADAKKLTQGKRYGMAFSAVGTEEGSFQFEPFFWTAGASLKNLNSPQAVQALTLWKTLVDQGSASKSVVTWTQTDINDQFAAGNVAMMINGPWQLPKLNAKKDLHFGIAPIPVPSSSAKPVTPLGGEVWTVGHSDRARERKAVAVVKCLLDPEHSLEWSKAAGYIPSDRAAAARLAASDPQLAAFVTEVGTAQARTAELGTGYPKVSEALWTALQACLVGGKTPQAALAEAQSKTTKS